MKDSQDWLDKSLDDFYFGVRNSSHESMGYDLKLDEHRNKVKSAIRKHFLQEALEMIGEDEPDFYDAPTLGGIFTSDQAATRNQLRQELRNKFNDKYKED